MITAQALAVCIFTAAQTYVVPPSVILGILNVEGGRIGQVVYNTNDTYDIGPMQINSTWVPRLARYWGVSQGTALAEIRDNPCINIGVGAWILRREVDKSGDLYSGIAEYHSSTPWLGHNYQRKVIMAMQRYRLVRTPADLVPLGGRDYP